MTTEQYELSGPISSIKYRNSDGWAVFIMANGQTCTGVLAEMIDEHSDVTCFGVYVDKPGYNQQLKCSRIVPALLKTDSVSGVAKLLQRLPGIGPKRAMEAVLEHGAERAWEIAKTDPELLGVPGSGVERAKSIAGSIEHNIEATIYLLGIGLTDNKCNRVIEHFGAKNAEKVVRENPYRLTEIDGFGFLTVDDIAFKAGISAGNQARVSACILYCLLDSQKNEGHVWHYGKQLIAIVLDTLSESAKKAEVPMMDMPGYDRVRTAIYDLASEGKVVVDEGRVYSKELLDAEKGIESALQGREVF